jgi:hypothetical protein
LLALVIATVQRGDLHGRGGFLKTRFFFNVVRGGGAFLVRAGGGFLKSTTFVIVNCGDLFSGGGSLKTVFLLAVQL